MPKHNRSSSASNRYGNSMPVPLAPLSTATAAMYNPRLMNTAAPSYYSPVTPGPSASLPSQPQSQPQYEVYSTAGPSGHIPAIPPRASSGAWTPHDDQTLLSGRSTGLNWSQIQLNYFPNKTPNACRKRHERLMERRGADDWDTRKLEVLAKEYMGMRREIWSGLAARTGEKWNVVEAKCMSNGLKNLQSAARSGARRERLESGQQLPPGYDDDSGISGIGLTPVDELDASYSSPETSASHSSSNHSGGPPVSYSSTGIHHHQLQSITHSSYGYPANHGYTSSVSSNGTNGGYPHGQRLPSVDMGIDAIINRPGGGGGGSGGL